MIAIYISEFIAEELLASLIWKTKHSMRSKEVIMVQEISFSKKNSSEDEKLIYKFED